MVEVKQEEAEEKSEAEELEEQLEEELEAELEAELEEEELDDEEDIAIPQAGKAQVEEEMVALECEVVIAKGIDESRWFCECEK